MSSKLKIAEYIFKYVHPFDLVMIIDEYIYEEKITCSGCNKILGTTINGRNPISVVCQKCSDRTWEAGWWSSAGKWSFRCNICNSLEDADEPCNGPFCDRHSERGEGICYGCMGEYCKCNECKDEIKCFVCQGCEVKNKKIVCGRCLKRTSFICMICKCSTEADPGPLCDKHITVNPGKGICEDCREEVCNKCKCDIECFVCQEFEVGEDDWHITCGNCYMGKKLHPRKKRKFNL